MKMMRQFLSILVLLGLFGGSSLAQPYLIQGNIEHAPPGKIYLASYYGDRFIVADSLESQSGDFLFLLSEEAAPGVYRLIFSYEFEELRTENSFVEFIYNREELMLNISVDADGPHPSFENSIENRVYFEFMSFQIAYEELIAESYGQLLLVEPDDMDHPAVLHNYERLQRDRLAFMDSLTLSHSDLYVTRILNAFRVPVIPGSLSQADRREELQLRFFEMAPMDDPGLLYAPVYTFRIVDYLSLYSLDTLSMEEQQEQYVEAVDQMMLFVPQFPELRSFVVEFMLGGFELLGMEQVQLYLADHYLDEACESDLAELVRSRMEAYKKMEVGATAPDFTIRDDSGLSVSLSELDHPYTLVMFWSSTCGHCRLMMPDLKQWYLEENSLDIEVVAISIDSSAMLYREYLGVEPMPWISSHEVLGWQGIVPSNYQIYATPTLFLLDRERTILARPASVRQLQRSLKKML